MHPPIATQHFPLRKSARALCEHSKMILSLPQTYKLTGPLRPHITPTLPKTTSITAAARSPGSPPPVVMVCYLVDRGSPGEHMEVSTSLSTPSCATSGAQCVRASRYPRSRLSTARVMSPTPRASRQSTVDRRLLSTLWSTVCRLLTSWSTVDSQLSHSRSTFARHVDFRTICSRKDMKENM